MAGSVTVWTTPRTGLEGGLVEHYLREVRIRGADAVALLLPTQRSVEWARRILLQHESGLRALVDPRLFTFPQLARAILVANHSPSRQLTALQRQLLVRQVLVDLQEKAAVAPVAALADRPGLLQAVCELLDELKRAAVSPEELARHAEAHLPGQPFHSAVEAIYGHYQKRLHELNLYDDPGLFWEALVLLEQGKLAPLEKLEVLLADGFEEFTTTQMRMLQQFAGWLGELHVRLCLDPTRPQMTPRAHATHEQLLKIPGARAQQEAVTGDTPQDSDLEAVRSRLFSLQYARRTSVDGSLQILAVAGGLVGECREIARRIKQLLAADPLLAAHEVAVVVRSWDTGYDVALREALGYYGIPAEFSRGPVLASVPAVAAVLSVLDVLEDGWLRQDVIKLLNSGYVDRRQLQPEAPSASQMEQMALEAGIRGGSLKAWAEGFQRLSVRLAEERAQRARLERELGVGEGDQARQQVLEDEDGERYRPLQMLDDLNTLREKCANLIGALGDLLQPLAEARSLVRAARALGEIANKLGIPVRARRGDRSGAALDLQGLQMLSELLRELAEAPLILGAGDQIEFSDFAGLLRTACMAARLPGERRRLAGVQVLDAAEARHERFRHVFVCGLREGLYPLRGRPDPFYDDDDREVLCRHIPGLRPRMRTSYEGAFLLYGALAAARETAWLTYPSTEADGGPVLRSHYLDEVLRHWEPDANGTHPPSDLVVERKQSQVLPGLTEACCAGEGMEALGGLGDRDERGAQALAGKLPGAAARLWHELVELCGSELVRLAAGAALVETQRSTSSGPGQYAGVMSQEKITKELEDRFGPQYIFPATRLNTYATCPMRFWFTFVLNLAPLEEFTEVVPARDLGLLAHRVLANFFRERQAGGDHAGPITAAELPAAQERMKQILKETRAEYEARGYLGDPVVWEQTLARLTEDLLAVLLVEAQMAEQEPWLTRFVERRYGTDGDFEVHTENLGPVKVQGRIDRVDVTEDGTRFAVYDYKTGNSPSAQAVMDGKDLQLPLYSLATRALLGTDTAAVCPPPTPGQETHDPSLAPQEGKDGATPAWWAYFRVTRPVERRLIGARNPDRLPDAEKKAIGEIERCVQGMRSGKFAAGPMSERKPCQYCDYQGLCRWSQTTASAG